jgi:AAA+ superfamily predicted ATPase
MDHMMWSPAPKEGHMTDNKEDNLGDDGFVIAPSNSRWAKTGNRYWTPSDTAESIPSGVYSVGSSSRIGIFIDQMQVVKDDLVVLPGMGADTILSEITKFWKKRERYLSLGVVHKRGILMEGPPGSGKTSNSELLIELFVKKLNGVVILASNVAEVGAGMTLIRQREPERPIMVVIEDIDAVARQGEEALLNLLDGKNQIGGVVFVATTNHLDRLPERIANRPSRFDLVIKVGLPHYDAKLAYIKAKWPEVSHSKADQIAQNTHEYSIAHLKELLILTEIFEAPLEEAQARIKSIMERKLLPDQAKLTVVKTAA